MKRSNHSSSSDSHISGSSLKKAKTSHRGASNNRPEVDCDDSLFKPLVQSLRAPYDEGGLALTEIEAD